MHVGSDKDYLERLDRIANALEKIAGHLDDIDTRLVMLSTSSEADLERRRDG